jgi:hypothetical protein
MAHVRSVSVFVVGSSKVYFNYLINITGLGSQAAYTDAFSYGFKSPFYIFKQTAA